MVLGRRCEISKLLQEDQVGSSVTQTMTLKETQAVAAGETSDQMPVWISPSKLGVSLNRLKRKQKTQNVLS